MSTSNPYRALFLGCNWINGKINTQNMNYFRPALISEKYAKEAWFFVALMMILTSIRYCFYKTFSM